MRIVVRFCENKSKTFEMEIDENNDVKRVKLMIRETNETYTKDYFHIFHRNIMLDNDRMVKFYAIEPNDEIYIGKIEHYLEDDDKIVELFVIGDSLSFEYVVVKRNDSISQLKSLISRIIPECVTVWSISGCEMKDDLIITDILIINGCYKLIIGCGRRNGSISDYFKIHDQYLVSSYVNKQKITFWYLDPHSKSEILQLKEKLIKLKESLENNKIIPNFNKYLPFIRSRYLFCMNTADEIWDICSEYWSSMIRQKCIHRLFIRDIFRLELNSELLIYSNIDSIVSNKMCRDSIFSYNDDNKNILTNIIRISMVKLVSKYEPTMKWLCGNWQEYNDLIPSKYIDDINGISDEIVNDMKTKFIIGSEGSLNCKEITNEFVDKYKRKVIDLLIDIENEKKRYKVKFNRIEIRRIYGLFEIYIYEQIGKILNFIQKYVATGDMKNERFEVVIKQHVACLLRECLSVIISRVDGTRVYSKWNNNAIVNESMSRMFIRIVLNSYLDAKSGLCKVNANISSEENPLNEDVTNEFLENKIIKDKLMENLLGLLPEDGKFEKIMRNVIDRLILKQKFDCTREDIVIESVNIYLDSEFSYGKFIEELSTEIFDSLISKYNIFKSTNNINLSYPDKLVQTRDIAENNLKQYLITSWINNSRFQEIFRNMLKIESINIESIEQESWLSEYGKGNRITEELMKNFEEYLLNHVKILSDNSFRSIVINALDNCINSLDDIFENPSYSMKFIRSFLFNNQSDYYPDEILTAVSKKHFAVKKIKHNNVDISLQIPVRLIKTNIQLKKSISSQTKIPIEQIYMIKYGEDEMSRDEENIGSIDEYLVALPSSNENIKKLDTLGNGAFGNVHLYEDKLTKCKFALKKSIRSDNNLNRDISIILQLQYSNNFPGFFRLFLCGQSLCIGMEYFSQGSLQSIIQENKHLSERDIAQYSHQILIQIDKMHQEYIIHRDIKSDNVVIDNKNNARLIDFGVSKNISGLTDKDLLEKLNQYEVGTSRYMAPELIRSEAYSEKVDIWSFGIMVVEMRTGQKPFHNMNSLQSTIHASSSEAINLDLPDDTSEELVQFIHSCLKKNPNERATAKQLLESKFIQKYANKTDIIGV